LTGEPAAAQGSALDRIVRLYRTSSDQRSVAALLVANLIPLVGVVFFGWSLATILVIYWLENGIVGFWNVPRMALAGRGALPAAVGASEAGRADRSVGRRRLVHGFPTSDEPMLGTNGSAAFLIAFFIVHYGLFWLVHGVFVFVLAIGFGSPTGFGSTTGFGSPVGPFGGDEALTPSTGPVLSQIALAAIALFISHGLSFFLDYVRGGEYRTTTIAVEMFRPYGRVIVLHVTILVGAFLAFALGSPLALLVVLVTLKTALDLALHARRHPPVEVVGATAAPPI
jgi:hypothetical protein